MSSETTSVSEPAPPHKGRVRRYLARHRRSFGAAFSLLVHLGVILAFVAHKGAPAPEYVPILMTVQLYTPPPPPPPPEAPVTPAPEEPSPKPIATPKQKSPIRKPKLPPPPSVAVSLPTGKDKSFQAGVEVSDAEVAGAATAGSGSTGGACNMVKMLQAALRKDARVQSTMASVNTGRPVVVWKGGWVRHGDQEGAGLAAVREAITWEVGFAPKACREQHVRGLVLLSLNDSPGAPRVILGGGDWRWSDLTH